MKRSSHDQQFKAIALKIHHFSCVDISMLLVFFCFFFQDYQNQLSIMEDSMSKQIANLLRVVEVGVENAEPFLSTWGA